MGFAAKLKRPTGSKTTRTTDQTSPSRAVLRFLWTFLVSLVVLSTAVSIWYVKFPAASAAFIAATAQIVAWSASVACDGIRLNGDLITYHGFSIRVVVECTGIIEIVIYLAAVISFPASWLRRLIGVVGGTALIILANVLRMATLLIIGASSEHWFEIAHYYAYQVSMLLLIVGVWIAWFYFAVLDRRKEPQPISA